MYKLLLLDIDGTLRDERFGVPESAKKAIKLCRMQHCKVVICTGRSKGMIQQDVLNLKVDGYIAGGGCYLEYKKKVIYKRAFEKEKINKVVQLLKISNAPFSIENQQKIFMNQAAKEIYEAMNKEKGIDINSRHQNLSETILYENNLDQFHGQPIHKICLWADEQLLNQVKEILNHAFELAQAEQCGDSYYYEIIQKGFHKGDAIEALQKLLNISREETISFGDGLNDTEMFAKSKVGVAMMKSHKNLKSVATSICEEPMNDGIYRELKRRRII